MHATKQDALYGGADLHGRNVLISLCDAEGVTVYSRRVKADIDSVCEALQPYQGRIERLGVESTFNWYWFVDGLSEAGYVVDLGNPAKMAQYSGIKETNDLTDAAWLAEQERLRIFPACYIYPKEVRPVRDMLRRRQLLVRQRTQSLLSVKSLLERYGIPAPDAQAIKKWSGGDIEKTGLDICVQHQLRALLNSLKTNDREALRLEEIALGFAKPTRDFKQVQTVPGIAEVLGLLIMLESGEFSRFPSAGDYASYCRAVKSRRISNEKKKGSNNRRNGNEYLAWAFVEAATYAHRFYPRIHAWYERKRQRKNVAVAKKALACKLSKAVWHVLNGKDYDEKMLFG